MNIKHKYLLQVTVAIKDAHEPASHSQELKEVVYPKGGEDHQVPEESGPFLRTIASYSAQTPPR